MEYLKKTTPVLGLILATVLFSNCSDIGSSASEANDVRQMKVTMTVGGENFATQSKTLSSGKHDTSDVEITMIKMLIDNLELETVSDDSVDFEINNLVVDLPLNGDTLEITNEQIPVGSYDKVDIEIDSDIVEDTVLNDDTGYYSIVVKGTYKNEEFTFKTNREFEEEFKFSPPIEVTDSTTSVSLNLDIDIDRWFKYADPTNPDHQRRIERNIAKSFNAYCRYGDDWKWHRDDDDDWNDHDDKDEHDDDEEDDDKD